MLAVIVRVLGLALVHSVGRIERYKADALLVESDGILKSVIMGDHSIMLRAFLLYRLPELHNIYFHDG